MYLLWHVCTCTGMYLADARSHFRLLHISPKDDSSFVFYSSCLTVLILIAFSSSTDLVLLPELFVQKLFLIFLAKLDMSSLAGFKSFSGFLHYWTNHLAQHERAHTICTLPRSPPFSRHCPFTDLSSHPGLWILWCQALLCWAVTCSHLPIILPSFRSQGGLPQSRLFATSCSFPISICNYIFVYICLLYKIVHSWGQLFCTTEYAALTRTWHSGAAH